MGSRDGGEVRKDGRVRVRMRGMEGGNRMYSLLPGTLFHPWSLIFTLPLLPNLPLGSHQDATKNTYNFQPNPPG